MFKNIYKIVVSLTNYTNRYNPKCNLLINVGILAIEVEQKKCEQPHLNFNHISKSIF